MYTDAYRRDTALPEALLVKASEKFLQKYEERLAANTRDIQHVDEEGWKTLLPAMVSQPTSRRRRAPSRVSHVDEDETERKLREFAKKYREDGFYAVQAREKARVRLGELRAQMKAEEEVMSMLRKENILHPFQFKL